ncbi:MAG: prepilin-type N-terminal cleavage/methylation domain-containing protein [Chloroflexi bacterium]|nr:prepilin-type N-terminal cleavage/methylation domain-containing protein [Chloroflexota bacterium]
MKVMGRNGGGDTACNRRRSRPHFTSAFVSLNDGFKAFTLIEIMIAITIFGMVMVAIYASWSAILRGSKAGLVAAAEVQRIRISMRALEESLASALLYTGNLPHYAFMADTTTSSDFAKLSFVARLPASFPGSGLFGDQVVRRVTFSVEQGTNGAPQLVLSQSPLLEATELVGEPYSIVLAPNVSLFAMEFWDARTSEWIPEWLYTNQLPKLVKVALGFGRTQQYSVQVKEVAARVITVAATPIQLGWQLGGSGPGPGQAPPGGNPLGQNLRDGAVNALNPGMISPSPGRGFTAGGFDQRTGGTRGGNGQFSNTRPDQRNPYSPSQPGQQRDHYNAPYRGRP